MPSLPCHITAVFCPAEQRCAKGVASVDNVVCVGEFHSTSIAYSVSLPTIYIYIYQHCLYIHWDYIPERM